jgi:two-component system, cell cycle response regulator DivK
MKHKPNWEGKTILVVDDEYMNFLLFEAILVDTNANVIYAVNGKKAVEEYVKNEKIDLILMDINMPVVNGYEATQSIKQLNRNVPIIAQTAYNTSEDYFKCISSGFDEYIAKPIEKELLLYKIGFFFNKSVLAS